ncbi:hypothetical protein PHYPSEUDO_008541 [Phytophthora pseudosyringae]|uniref:Cadmium resistance transporter n=1 Tax=Phytophthora pseudosyringae TaxID=221518 RepID=A0A8T1VDR9_9STRA|nr:hypothetical protein PHYPSEUDO_008541 [Phytophthora pseudosyringae]
MGIWGVIASAVVMFASTNIDVAIVLVVCFANAAEGKDGLKARHVWIGQFIGFSILVAISLAGALAGSFLPPHYSGLLGFVPLCMGFVKVKEWCNKDEGASDDDLECGGDYRLHAAEQAELAALEVTGQKGQVSRQSTISEADSADGQGERDYQLEAGLNDMSIGFHEEKAAICEPSCGDECTGVAWNPEEGSQSSGLVAEEVWSLNSRTSVDDIRPSARWLAIFSFHSLKMTAVTLSNGGDNVAVYISGLGTYRAGDILLTLAIFYLLLIVWLYVTHAFVSIRLMSNFIRKYGIYIIPIALVSLGVYILWSAEVLCLVSSTC